MNCCSCTAQNDCEFGVQSGTSQVVYRDTIQEPSVAKQWQMTAALDDNFDTKIFFTQPSLMICCFGTEHCDCELEMQSGTSQVVYGDTIQEPSVAKQWQMTAALDDNFDTKICFHTTFTNDLLPWHCTVRL